MADRVPLPSITGLLSGFVGEDLFAGHFATASRLVGFQPAVTDPPSGGSATVELRTAAGGGGDALSAVIADGTRFPATPVTGAVDIPAGTDLYLRLTAATGGPMGLYGQYLVESAAGATTALTTLSRVKDYLGSSGSADDTILTQLIGSVSLRMQTAMRRKIVAETVASEKCSAPGGALELLLRKYPVSASGFSVSVDGTALAAEDYDVELDSGIVFYTPGGGTPSPWPRGKRHIEVGYEAGFGTVPEDIQNAATVQVVWELKRTGVRDGRLGERSQLVGDNQTTFLVDAWAPDVIPVIEHYRARSI